MAIATVIRGKPRFYANLPFQASEARVNLRVSMDPIQCQRRYPSGRVGGDGSVSPADCPIATDRALSIRVTGFDRHFSTAGSILATSIAPALRKNRDRPIGNRYREFGHSQSIDSWANPNQRDRDRPNCLKTIAPMLA